MCRASGENHATHNASHEDVLCFERMARRTPGGVPGAFYCTNVINTAHTTAGTSARSLESTPPSLHSTLQRSDAAAVRQPARTRVDMRTHNTMFQGAARPRDVPSRQITLSTLVCLSQHASPSAHPALPDTAPTLLDTHTHRHTHTLLSLSSHTIDTSTRLVSRWLLSRLVHRGRSGLSGRRRTTTLTPKLGACMPRRGHALCGLLGTIHYHT